MKSMYTVSEIARYFNISNQTLHYYDRIGLFRPSYVDPQTKYRYYDQEQFNKMFLIKELKSIGFSLEEIAAVQKNHNLESLSAVLKENRRELMRKMKELDELKAHIDFYMDMISLSKHPKKKAGCEMRVIPARHVFYVNANFALEDLSQYVEIIYKAYVKAARLQMPANNRNEMVLTMNQSAIMQGKFKYYSGIGLLVPKALHHPNAFELKESLYATAIHVGEYGSLPATYKRLCSFIWEQSYVIDGYATEVSLANVVQTRNPREFVTEIQIPVIPKAE